MFDTWTSFHLPGDPGPAARALVDTLATKIDVTIEKSGKLSGAAEIEFASLADGARLLNVRLAPRLRVSRMTARGAELKFIQEDERKDADLWVIFPKPLVKGEKGVLTVEYAGEDVVQKEGNGNFYVGSRSSWFPKLDIPGDPFTDRAVYQLRSRTPKEFTLVGTGKLIRRSTEGNYSISERNTEIPYTVVGFNFGSFKTKSAKQGGTEITVYVNDRLNDELRQMDMIASQRGASQLGIGGAITTTGMANAALSEAVGSIQLFTHYFGPLGFPALSITQQPVRSYGQSWPTLVFLPYIAFLDPTIRNQWGISHSRSTREFLEGVGPHEVAHQWWGHLVGVKTCHDEWLSEGFAEYSAGLYLHATGGDAKFRTYLEGQRDSIFAPLYNSRLRACDAGPIWLGRRLSTVRNPDAFSRLVYAKGAYVLHMLRMIAYNFATRDDSRFIAMMRDFVETYRGRDASTEDFRKIIEEHFGMDMSWFFNQWVYGSEQPSLTVRYGITPNEKGALFHGTVEQRGVSKNFRTVLPVLMFAGQKGMSGKLIVEGENTPFKFQLGFVPERVEFNPLHAVLCEMEVKKM
ncbi:MAG TPA: M1 family aminopeptidase [Bryobacteraceae bacterium]|nr:M1 family aminopeptidase [Bryobacteraceae bacterium]HOQ45688.1 M1 family aminopeptidase [Bryobacteraceae bacterium]HPQ14444.1 M1 family aminopeptidase [Bryobacteraceae bacterium]HPU71586.1 M1 family aminopeptidase [Bryobacteraceae bacterium]